MKEKMKIFKLNLVCFCLFLGSFSQLKAQSLVEDANLSQAATNGENVFTETIKIISASKKIFVVTNNNAQMGPGDFVSLALDNKLAARAVVAKNHQGQVGIKILKIYSMAQWGRLRRNMDVQIVRGDDSAFAVKKAAEVAAADGKDSKIKSEDDLYTGDVVIEDEIGVFDDNKNRHIKPDNVVSVGAGYKTAPQTETAGGGTARATEFGIAWAYQFSDNYFIEGIYGRANFQKYPANDVQTVSNHLIARLKYNIKGPLYTFFMPYAGWQSYTISSPAAGKSDTNTAEQNEAELKAIDDLKKSGPVFGVTILRRLVPGWFIKADLGTDILNIGFAIEF